MAASAKLRWKRISAFIEDTNKQLAPLVPVKARVKVVGSFAIDKDGGWNLGGKADIADVTTLVGGVPVAIEGGVEQKHDTQGKSDLEIEIEYGPPATV